MWILLTKRRFYPALIDSDMSLTIFRGMRAASRLLLQVFVDYKRQNKSSGAIGSADWQAA
jgi:hypothetical protein